MTLIAVDRFGGLAPIYDPRKLPEYAATVARDGKFDGQDFRPLYEHKDAMQPLAFAVSRLFKYRYKGDSRWLGWPTPWDVDVVSSPIPMDEYGRLYWSRVDPASINDNNADNHPRMAMQPTQADILSDSPSTVRRLGVPAPTEAPGIAEQRQNMTITTDAVPPQITAMSQTAPVTVTAPEHPFEDGWTVTCKDPTNSTDSGGTGGDGGDQGGIVPDSRGMAQVLGLEFVVGNVKPDTFDLRGSDGSNYNAFVPGTTNMEISRVYDDSDMETRSYVYTFVTDIGEEGPPSPPSDPRDFRYDSTVTVTCKTSGADWAALHINRVRVYRTASGSQSTDFYFVGEIALPSGENSVDFSDNVESIQLGEILPSTTWSPAPNGLRGLRRMPNGFLVGFIGNTLYLSEPYLPHAWPDEYRKTVHDEIVGIEVYGQTLVVATKGRPEIGTATDPASMSLARLDIDAPCLSKGGLCSIGSGVVYPTPDGLAFVSASSAEIATNRYIDKREWAELWSDTMEAIYYDQRYIAFCRDTGKNTMILERRPDMLAISDASIYGRAPCIDPDTDELNFIKVDGSNQRDRYVWEGGDQRGSGRWASKVWTLPRATNLCAGQVFAESYPLILKLHYANLQPSTGQPLGEVSDSIEVTVAGPEVFWLPSGFMSREWQAEIITTAAVQGVNLTDNPDELRQS